ncbi:MAG: 2-amino-4-hydroxy-6-hydroxymethyldihydropteridine diphosphokinase [Gammaproteobacteria bacterium]|nr:2-amino-4-hydroxy-6-hydroxymethyldihydropteridine diphosphokinase [Gammaproteobacteria bacterium]
MARIYIGVGSNINRDENLRSGIRRLREEFGDIDLSTVYETEAVGFEGDNFYNMVVGIDTELAPQQVYDLLHEIEAEYGRRRRQERYSSRKLDLDLLLYDDQVIKTEQFELPRYDVDEYPFVLAPLAELDGERRHPVSGRTFNELWQEYDKSDLRMRPVDMKLDMD